MKKFSFLYFILSAFLFTSCVSKKKVIYFQEIDTASTENKSNYEPVIKTDDVLYINVTTLDPKASEPFNIGKTEGGSSGSGLQVERSTYLVDNAGTIQFPVLGTLKVSGLNKNQVKELLFTKISEYAKDPVINLRIVNYKVSVLGEVANPGSYTISSDRITIPEALALAGDMTLFGRRENVLLIRETEGVKTTVRINMTDPNLLNSPYYYLTQNDVLYVEPNKRKIDSTAIGPNILAAISVLGFALTTIILLTD
jgi:polysaccharide export outer membrane protein